MYPWSPTSENRLISCHPDIIKVANEVRLYVDSTVVYGFRGEAEQEEAFRRGDSMVHFPFSKHNKYPSRAIDLLPYPIDWFDLRRLYYFGGFVLGVANSLDIKLRWGGDWDGDFQVKDQRFNDLAHFELV